MALHGLSPLVLLTLSLSLAMIPAVKAGNQIALNSMSVDNDNDNETLYVTVIYTADYEPEVTWVMPTFRAGGGMVNLDFQQTDTFSHGQGQTTVKIQHDVARTQNSKVFYNLLFLRNPDCEVMVYLKAFDDLISGPSFTQTFHNLALVLEAKGKLLDPGQDLVLRHSNMDVTVRLASPELSKFEVNSPWVRHSRFEYAPGDFAGRVNDYGYRDGSGLEYARGWTGNSTAKQLRITLRRSASTGILSIYNLNLKQLSGTQSIVQRIEFKQNLYVLRSPSEEVVRKNTVYIRNEHSHYLTEFDMPMSLHVPQFSFNVVGNPLPQVSLHRACSEVSEEEVEVFETRVSSRYEITYFFRFKNATEALAGSYNVVARSGTMEAREIMSLGIYH